MRDMNQEHRAMFEEILSMVTLVAGLLAHEAGAIWFSYFLFGKSVWDLLCALKCWVKASMHKYNASLGDAP